MLAKRVSALPAGDTWIFEPKWDGFRTLIFREGEELLLQSRDQKSLNRYFPELVAPLLAWLPQQCVLDGKIVVAQDVGLDFDALQLRVHPRRLPGAAAVARVARVCGIFRSLVRGSE
jgi:ATP-dependent DNA ligase